MAKRPRPILRWHGGKYILAPWIVSHLPGHRVYVEPFAGAASVLFAKEPSYAEVLNDMHDDLVNFMQVIREYPDQFYHKVYWTSFSRKEFELSYQSHPDPVERARRFVVRSFMGFGSNSASGSAWTGFRANSNRSGTTPSHDWANWCEHIKAFSERLRGVVLECRDYRRVVADHDSEETLFYFDPPYMLKTRNAKHAYVHDWNDADHEGFLDLVLSLKGKSVISSYPHELYERKLQGWQRFDKAALADGAKKRTEVLWVKE